MNLIYLYGLMFLVMLSLPVGIAVMYHIKKPAEPMYINQNRQKDQRFFAKNFSKNIAEATIDSATNKITINQQEIEYIEADKGTNYPNKVNKLILAYQKELEIPKNVTTLNQGVYSEQDIIINHPNVTCNLMYSKKNIYLNAPVTIGTWIDAENCLTVNDGCHLGISASSNHQINLYGDCEFRRLYAPAIYCGEDVIDNDYDFSQIDKKEDYISKGEIKIVENTIFIGDIRSYKSVEIADNTIMKGNVFADGEIIIGKNCIIYGNIFSQEKIIVGEGSAIGHKGSIRSIIARDTVILHNNCAVYGFISCEKGGYKRSK